MRGEDGLGARGKGCRARGLSTWPRPPARLPELRRLRRGGPPWLQGASGRATFRQGRCELLRLLSLSQGRDDAARGRSPREGAGRAGRAVQEVAEPTRARYPELPAPVPPP